MSVADGGATLTYKFTGRLPIISFGRIGLMLQHAFKVQRSVCTGQKGQDLVVNKQTLHIPSMDRRLASTKSL